MEDDKLYRQALEEMKELAERVLEECCEFAEDNDYEKRVGYKPLYKCF